MFLTVTRSGYTTDGEQFTSGKFLLLLQPPGLAGGKQPIRALVRHCSLHQFGHFMMGRVRIKNQTIIVSGSYGQDGLPKSVPDEIYKLGTLVPEELVEAWNKGGGWNGAGSEAPAMREWARKTFKV